MKFRTDFVTNSSSSGFVVTYTFTDENGNPIKVKEQQDDYYCITSYYMNGKWFHSYDYVSIIDDDGDIMKRIIKTAAVWKKDQDITPYIDYIKDNFRDWDRSFGGEPDIVIANKPFSVTLDSSRFRRLLEEACYSIFYSFDSGENHTKESKERFRIEFISTRCTKSEQEELKEIYNLLLVEFEEELEKEKLFYDNINQALNNSSFLPYEVEYSDIGEGEGQLTPCEYIQTLLGCELERYNDPTDPYEMDTDELTAYIKEKTQEYNFSEESIKTLADIFDTYDKYHYCPALTVQVTKDGFEIVRDEQGDY